MDVYSGYNQIPMYKGDQEATIFITNSDTYCYKVMSSVLKNAGTTYPRLVIIVFQEQIEGAVKVSIDDKVVKISLKTYRIHQLEEVFKVLQRCRMKLNPTKSTFGILPNFLGSVITQRGIEAYPNQIEAIQNMLSPRNV